MLHQCLRPILPWLLVGVLSLLSFRLSANPPQQRQKSPGVIKLRMQSVGALGVKKPISLAELKAIHGKIRKPEFLSMQFTQTSYKSLRKKTTTAAGEALFARPRMREEKFRWKLLRPRREEWVYNGRSLVHFHPDKNRAIRYSTKARKLHELKRLVDIVLNLEKLLTDYDMVDAYRQGKHIWVSLKTKAKQAGELKSISVKLDAKTSHISWLKLFLSRGNYTEFAFSGVRSVAIPKSRFNLPKGVSISDVLR